MTGLDPNGDNYLSLRTGPGSKYREITRMGPGTVVEVLESKGAWRRVRLEDGTVGWAFGKYIASGPAPDTEEVPPETDAGDYDVVEPDQTEAPPSDEAVTEPSGGKDSNADLAAKEDALMSGIIEDISRGLSSGN